MDGNLLLNGYIEQNKNTGEIYNINDRILQVLLQYKEKKTFSEWLLLWRLNKLYSVNVENTYEKVYNMLVVCGYINDDNLATIDKSGKVTYDGRKLTSLALEALKVNKFVSESKKRTLNWGIIISFISAIVAILTFFGKESVIEIFNYILKK